MIPRQALVLATLVMAAAACTGDPDGAKKPFEVDVMVFGDGEHGLPGAQLALGTTVLGTTDETGLARLALTGAEGDSFAITLRCPAGFDAPAEALQVPLRRFSAGSRAPLFKGRCAPSLRTIVVGIRAENGPDLPVLYLGKEVGRTDESGAAHVVLNVKAGEQVTLALDTRTLAEGRPHLRPDSPTLTFVAKERDDVVILDQKFDIDKPAARRRSAPRPGPTRI
ncbi:MAG: hypothetical protein JWP97_4002 [Labilithrix sp.]|nr:hypothetical protein [Labilithrix sp.]